MNFDPGIFGEGFHRFVQMEIALFGITFVAYSPLGRGFLTGAIKSRADLETSDWRLTLPRFTDEAISENLKFVEVIDKIAQSKKVSKAQIALAWVLSQNDEIVSIPGLEKYTDSRRI